MTRDALFDKSWFDEWVAYDESRILKMRQALDSPAADPTYRPQYAYELSRVHLRLLLRRYSRGDPIVELVQHLPPLLDAWEEAERWGKEVWTEQQQHARHAWKVNLDHYIDCFWLTGLALALELPDAPWNRLVALMGNEGEDALLDRVISTRQAGRPIGRQLCHPHPYQRLLDAIEAKPAERPWLLKGFVAHWYAELDRPPAAGLSRDTAVHERPHWYELHLGKGAYFGYWCIEAVAAVRAFGIDDSLCLGLPHYPGDLLRPQGPTSHREATAAVQRRAAEAVAVKQTFGDRVRKALFAPRQ